jgi:deoxycytidylate deaminase
MTERYREKLIKFVRFADDLADLSTCKRDKVGAIIFAHDCTCVYSIGYNGPARHRGNDSCTGERGKCGCAHAEMNALVKLDVHTARPSILYCTKPPCAWCANGVLNSGIIIALLYSGTHRDQTGLEMLREQIPCITREELLHGSMNRPLADRLRFIKDGGR